MEKEPDSMGILKYYKYSQYIKNELINDSNDDVTNMHRISDKLDSV